MANSEESQNNHSLEECWKHVQHERELREQWEGAHERFHTLDKEALVLARREIDRRLEEMNQFRDQIARERGDFLRRDVYEQRHNSFYDSVDTRLKALENNKSNMEGRMWAMGAIITAISSGLAFLLHYLGK